MRPAIGSSLKQEIKSRDAGVIYVMARNDVSLKEYLEAKIDAVDLSARDRSKAQDEAVRIALVGAKEDIAKVAESTEKRFESVNEFRSALSDQARLTMPRSESEALHKATLARNDAEYKTINGRIDNLALRMNAYDAHGQGKQSGWGTIASVIAIATAVVSMIVVFMKL